LGPVLFTIYTRKLVTIVRRHLPKVHCYADDTQLYVSFSPDSSASMELALNSMTNCLADIRKWMLTDKLKLNDDKTELLLIGTKKQLNKVNIDSIAVGSTDVVPTSSVRNLGAWFDSQLSMSSHISKLCGSAF
jgi:hypothetical protein